MTSFHSMYFDNPPCEGRILDIFLAERPSQDVALFFVHGGGWRGGARAIFHSIIHAYRERGFDCASTDYRLKGTTLFDQVSDIRTGLGLFAAKLAENGRPARVVIIGSSAGAHLALLTALASPEECGKPQTPIAAGCEVAGVVVHAAPFTFEPWEDMFPESWSAMQNAVAVSYHGNEELYRQASPMAYIRKGNPPVFALHAENEHMFPLDLAAEFAERSRDCGNIVHEKTYPRTEHGFFYSLERWQQREAFEDILQFAINLKTD